MKPRRMLTLTNLAKRIQIFLVFVPIVASFLPMDQFLVIGTISVILLFLNISHFVRTLLDKGNFIIYIFSIYMGILALLNENILGLIAVFFLTLIIIYISFLRSIITKILFESLMVVIALGSIFSLYYCTVNFYSTSTYLLYEYFIELIHIPFSYVIGIADSIRSSSTFIQPNYYGHLSALISLICLFYILSSIKGIYHRKWIHGFKLIFYAFILIVNLVALQLTQSRSAYIGLIVGAIVLILFFDARTFIVISVVVIFLIFLRNDDLLTFIPRMDSAIVDGKYRIGLFKAAIEEIKKNWLIGKGFYTFPLVWGKYVSKYEVHVHNIFLEIMMDSGIVGIVLLGTYYSTYVQLPIKDWVNRNREYLPLVFGVIALEVTNGMTDAVLIFPQSFIILSIVLLSLELNVKSKTKTFYTKSSMYDSSHLENNE